MIEGLKPYAAYNDSGLPWLDQKPGHWRTARNGNLFQQRNDTHHSELPILEVSLRTGVRIRDFDGTKRKQVMADAAKYKRAGKGDIAYNMMRMWQGAVGVAPADGLVSPAYVVARSLPGVCARYFTTLFRCGFYMGEIDAASRGIVKDRNRLYWDQFKQMQSLVPPPEEQEAIVRFLAHANQKIDGFIRAKRKLIGLLNEQKQAIIHQAVTRGLDPSVPLKPSGIPWLGDIPKHWELKRFKFVATINSGQVDPTMQSFRQMVLIAPNHIQSGTGRIVGLETASSQGADSGKYLVSRGQVIYSKIRPNLKKAVIAPCDCLCSADMYPITPRSEILPEFLLTLLLSQPFTNFATDASMRVAMPKVNREALANCHMWYPSHDEQLALLAAVEKESEPYNRAITRTEREIALMQEYRTRLTADLVTGRLDVREAASKLPEVDNYSLPQTADDADETEEAMEEEEA